VYSNVVMCEIQNIYEFIYFMILTLFFITWNGGQMVKALDCGQGGEGSSLNLDILWLWPTRIKTIMIMWQYIYIQEW